MLPLLSTYLGHASPLQGIRAGTPEPSGKLQIEAAYLEGHVDRMRCAEFRHQILFAGSAAMTEAGYRTAMAAA